MKKPIDIAEVLKAADAAAANMSWFRDSPHRWASASLPLAYAVACVEVVSKRSEKAGILYQKIIEGWGKPGVNGFFEAVHAEIPASEQERMKQALVHPETELLPDPNMPFRELERMFVGMKINDALFKDDAIMETLSETEELEVGEAAAFIALVLESVVVGFNRESDMEKGRYRVLPSNKAPWLLLAVMLRTNFEHHNVSLEKLRAICKLRRHKGKVIDFHKVLTEEPMSRWHRRMIANGKAVGLKLKNDRVFVEAARRWYQCRVAYSSIEKYCDAESAKGMILDPKNVYKQIRPCDEALGYRRRLPRG